VVYDVHKEPYIEEKHPEVMHRDIGVTKYTIK